MRARRRTLGVPPALLALTIAVGGCGFGGDDETDATPPRSGAQTILLQDRSNGGGLEVLLVRRSQKARLLPGTWVLPGGSGSSDEDGGDIAVRTAAAIYPSQQAGIKVKAADLVPYAEWVGILSDTHFYLAAAPATAARRPRGSQNFDAAWFVPQRALEMHRAGDLPLDYAATKQLESLIGFASTTAAFEATRRRDVEPIQLRVVGEGAKRRAVLPEDAP
jgi:ADP-ribose pyrophosphatase YjhB (NUDIX family)